MRYSIIIPTLNEEQMLPKCLARIASQRPPGTEVIVADGGSNDATLHIAQQAGATICQAPRGRGMQCNAGAAQARGDILMFLYADSLIPHNAFTLLDAAFSRNAVEIGTFRLQFDMRHPLLDPSPFVTQFDTVFTRFGDQCIVIRRPFFDKLGGFPDWPLFEDVRLLEEARFRTCVCSFPATVLSSARKYRRHGVLENHLMNVWLIVQYLMGYSPHELARRYWH